MAKEREANKGKGDAELSAAVEKVLASIGKKAGTSQVRGNALPRLDPAKINFDDLWAWCDALREKGLTPEECDAILAEVRRRCRSE